MNENDNETDRWIIGQQVVYEGCVVIFIINKLNKV